MADEQVSTASSSNNGGFNGNEREPVEAPAVPAEPGVAMAHQVRESSRWLGTQDTPIQEQHRSHTRPVPTYSADDAEHPGIWPQLRDMEGPIWNIAHALVGNHSTTTLGAKELYRTYKHTPHAPASTFLKYLIHRHNHLAEYDDPARGHELDKSFLGLVQQGRAADKNGHLSIKNLHDWTARHAAKVMPELLQMRDETQAAVAQDIGLGTRSINGEPYVALTRGLDDELMSNEHPLSSHADQPETGFGRVQHHSWVPLRDVWFSYDLGPRFSSGNMGPESEWLVSNTGTRYQATPDDVRAHRANGANFFSDTEREHALKLLPSSATDQQLAEHLATFGYTTMPSWVADHPSAGPAVFQLANKRGILGSSYANRKWVPREHALKLVNAGIANRDWYKKAVRNPNLTTQDLAAIGTNMLRSMDVKNSVHSEHVKAWLRAPQMNSQVLEQVWRNSPVSPMSDRLLSSPLATPNMLQGTVDRVTSGWFDKMDVDHTLRTLKSVAANPHHTPEQAQAIYDWVQKNWPPSNNARPKDGVSFLGMMKLPEQTVRDIAQVANKPYELNEEPERPTASAILNTFVERNPHSAPVVAKLAEDGLLGPRWLDNRLNYMSKLEPELQPTFINLASRRPAKEGRVLMSHLSTYPGLTQDTINVLAHYPDSLVRDNLFHNKSVTPEQIREAFPKGEEFPAYVGAPGARTNIANEIASGYYRRKNWEQKLLAEHFVKPLPQNLAKSELDLWQAQARDWLSHQTTKGYYYSCSRERATNIIRDEAIEPQLTDQVLDGEAVFAHRANPVYLDKWLKTPGADEVVLYFETPLEPQQHDDGSFYWTQRVPIENAHIADARPQEEPLAKFHTPLKFPALGLGDDKRETLIAATPGARRTFMRAAANQSVRENMLGDSVERVATDPQFRQETVDKTHARYMKVPSHGVTIEGNAGPGMPGHGLASLDQGSVYMGGAGQSAVSAALTPTSFSASRKFGPNATETVNHPSMPGATVVHEDLHRMFSRVQHKYGRRGRDMLSQNLMLALPQDLRTDVLEHLHWRDPNQTAGVAFGQPDEEAITELGSYLNVAPQRDQFHRYRQDSPEAQRAFHDKMKRAYRLLQAVAATADHRWTGRLRPWLKKGQTTVAFHEPQGFAHLSAQAAHEVFKGSLKLCKSYPDLVDPNAFAFEFENDLTLYAAVVERRQELDLRKKTTEYLPVLPTEKVFGPGEESAARAMLGHRAEHEKALAAARFLVGRKHEVDEDMFRLALGVYDGDYERAALISVGLTDSDANLRALRAAMKMGEFSPDHVHELTKNEPGTPNIETVQPGAPAAQETAEEVQRAVSAGLVQPLVLGGKHSKGAMAVRDPRTGDVLLLKPGSGKQSPAKGIRDDPSSQSAREAAFWHCSKVMGLDRYLPRCDLLLVNGAQVAAMKLLGPQWKSLDEFDTKVAGYAREVLQPYLARGDLHRFAVMDWVLGQVDRHGSNIMTHADSVVLIDEGSTMAGRGYDPARDTKSFVPYYLRVFTPSGFKKRKPVDRVRELPVLSPDLDSAFKKWLHDIDPAMLMETMQSHSIGQVSQEAVLERLADLQRYTGSNLSRYVNELWSGLIPPPPLR